MEHGASGTYQTERQREFSEEGNQGYKAEVGLN